MQMASYFKSYTKYKNYNLIDVFTNYVLSISIEWILRKCFMYMIL